VESKHQHDGACTRYGKGGDAEMRREPDYADLGRQPGGQSSRCCRIHKSGLIFGTWPLLPLLYQPSCFIHAYIVSMLQFPIKLEHAETDVTRLVFYNTPSLAASFPHLLPIRFPRLHFCPTHMICFYDLTPRSESPDPISMRRVDAQR
jgi:hypothetical protein